MNNKIKKIANGNISKLIQIFNDNITVLWEYKIKVLEPSENEEINMQDFLMYNTLKEDLIDILNEIIFINKHFFFWMLTEYVIILFEKLYHIIDMK